MRQLKSQNRYGYQAVYLFLALFLTGCALPKKEEVVIRGAQVVQTEVMKPCEFKWPDKAPVDHVAALKPSSTYEERLDALLIEREELKAYAPQLVAILQGCEKKAN